MSNTLKTWMFYSQQHDKFRHQSYLSYLYNPLCRLLLLFQIYILSYIYIYIFFFIFVFFIFFIIWCLKLNVENIFVSSHKWIKVSCLSQQKMFFFVNIITLAREKHRTREIFFYILILRMYHIVRRTHAFFSFLNNVIIGTRT